jgi:hypothetical protein
MPPVVKDNKRDQSAIKTGEERKLQKISSYFAKSSLK